MLHDEYKKTHRILEILEMLMQNQPVRKRDLINKFEITDKSIFRYIAELNNYFSTRYNEDDSIIYDKKIKGYRLKDELRANLTEQECLSVIKLILDSRAFSHDDLSRIIGKLMYGLSKDKTELLKNFYSKEIDEYIPIKNNKSMFKIMWDINSAAKEQFVVNIKYHKIIDNTVVDRAIEPLSIMFSEYYFYTLAYDHNRNKRDNPITFRLDKILEYNITDIKFKKNNAIDKQFHEGEFRKQMQFMNFGDRITVTFEFWGRSVEAVLDRLPTAVIKEKYFDNEKQREVYRLTATIYGKGVKMWFLSQAEYLRVTAPKDFVDEMRDTIDKMKNNYN